MSKPIIITDNFVQGLQVNKNDLKNLERVAGESLSTLTKRYEGLLIYPQVLGEYGDGLDERDKVLCTIDNGLLKTHNIMGYISIPSEDGQSNTLLHIGSRFDAEYSYSPEKKKTKVKFPSNNFINYILWKVGCFNITNWDYNEGNSSFFDDLTILLFPRALCDAIRKGLFKQYKSFQRNDANVHGTINFNRHIRTNIPFQGNVAYEAREHTYDNDVTELIRHTIEYIKGTKYGQSLLDSNTIIRESVDLIITATPSFDANQLSSILDRNIRPVIHPFYTEYASLQKLCIEILRNGAISYGNENNEIHGILFDGAWLWETYLATLLEPIGFVHPNNISKTNALKLFKQETNEERLLFNRNMYPDFYNEKYVLDAKYKHLDSFVQRSDLYQVITYMHTMKLDSGGYLYPYQVPDNEEAAKVRPYTLNGYGGTLTVIPFVLPKIQCKWNDYKVNMKNQEDLLQNMFEQEQ